jgi:hypothetical protein
MGAPGFLTGAFFFWKMFTAGFLRAGAEAFEAGGADPLGAPDALVAGIALMMGCA